MSSIAPESTRARRFKRTRLAWLVAAVLFLAPGAGSWAGNEKIIDERTRELEELNKRAVEQVPDIPGNGTIHIKADGAYREGEIRFTIRESSTTSTMREGEALDNEAETDAPKNEIIQFQETNNQETNNQTMQTEGRDGEDDPVEN